MPRFYFDIVDNQELSTDHEGIEMAGRSEIG